MDVLTSAGLLLLRIGLSVELVIHGWPKIKKPSGFAGFLGQVGLPGPMFWAWVVALVEFLGGIGLLLGLVTRPIAFLVLVEFLVIILAIKTAKWKKPFTTPQGEAGWEWDWLIATMAAGLLVAGPGYLSLDRLLSFPL